MCAHSRTSLSQGATIHSAKLSLRPRYSVTSGGGGGGGGGGLEGVVLNVAAADTADAPPLTRDPHVDMSGQGRTAGSVAWVVGLWASGERVTSPDLSAVVQV